MIQKRLQEVAGESMLGMNRRKQTAGKASTFERLSSPRRAHQRPGEWDSSTEGAAAALAQYRV
jgi:hypothetical protein